MAQVDITGIQHYTQGIGHPKADVESLPPVEWTDSTGTALRTPAGGSVALGGGGGSSAPVSLTATRNTTSGDSGAILENATASVLTLTLVAGTIPAGVTLMNTGTGQTVVTAGAGVTFVDGATSAAAPFQGQMIHIIPTVTANKFLVKVG